MEYNDLRKYINDYVVEYFPYKDNNEFRRLMDYLVEHYFKDIYNDIPERLKVLYEKQEIISTIYDKLLIAIGFPKDIISKLHQREKLIILNSLHDFQRYKASVSFVRKVCSSFNDKFNVYELFIDRTNSNEWVFKPYLISRNDLIKTLDDTTFTYDEIYNKVPSLLVSKEQLESMYSVGELVLPIKSNILFLDFYYSSNISIMYQLIVTIFLKQYKSKYISVYFSDMSFNIQLQWIYYLWYYLITRYHNTTWTKDDLNHYIINGQRISSWSTMNALKFLYNSLDIPYSIHDLDNLLDRYNNLSTRRELDDYYYEVFDTNFRKRIRELQSYDYTDLSGIFQTIEPEVSEYIENRISSAEDKQKEIELIIDEIYNSLILSVNISGDGYYKKYSEYFLRYLPQISIIPENTTTYMLLHNFKPFHTELVTRASMEFTVKDDKYNDIILDTEPNFLMELMNVSVVDFYVDKFTVEFIYNHSNLDFSVSQLVRFLLTFNKLMQYYLSSRIGFEETLEMATIHPVKLLSFANSLTEVNISDNYSVSDTFEVVYPY